jgi:hypothetical protein
MQLEIRSEELFAKMKKRRSLSLPEFSGEKLAKRTRGTVYFSALPHRTTQSGANPCFIFWYPASEASIFLGFQASSRAW